MDRTPPHRAASAAAVLVGALVLLGAGGAADAADLASIPRRILKEPRYATRAPEYLLLVFGMEMKTRVWVVIDGDTMYVDKNGNGDLSEPGEAVKPSETNVFEDVADVYAEQKIFEVAEVVEAGGAVTHKDLVLSRKKFRDKVPEGDPGATALLKMLWENHPTGYWTDLRVQVGGKQEQSCTPVLETRPADAPVVHFGGPIRLALSPVDSPFPLKIVRSDPPAKLTAVLGTRGIGAGTFAGIKYYDVPREVNPVLEITFQARRGATPVTMKFTLDARC